MTRIDHGAAIAVAYDAIKVLNARIISQQREIDELRAEKHSQSEGWLHRLVHVW